MDIRSVTVLCERLIVEGELVFVYVVSEPFVSVCFGLSDLMISFLFLIVVEMYFAAWENLRYA